MLKEIINDPERKKWITIFKELISLTLLYKELPVHYFSRYLYKSDIENVKDYLPGRFLSKIPPQFNESLSKQVLDDKLYFSIFYNRYGIRLPQVVAYNNKKFFTANNKTTLINSYQDFSDFSGKLFRENPTMNSLFIKKTYASSGGKNIDVLMVEDLDDSSNLTGEIYDDLINGAFVFQEGVVQHPEMSRLNPASLNTIRFDTYIDKEGNIDIISGLLKMSINNAKVDNLSSGGCAVGVDLTSGRLRKKGHARVKYHGTKVLSEHPITGVIFEDFSVPYLKEAMDMVIQAAGMMPSLRLVGWDVGIGENGPVLIEGNSDYGISTNDLAYGGYMSNKLFRKVLRELNYL